MTIDRARLSTFEESIAPFQKVVASDLLQVKIRDRVRKDYSLDTPFGLSRRVKTTLSSQVAQVRFQGLSCCRAFDAAYRRTCQWREPRLCLTLGLIELERPA